MIFLPGTVWDQMLDGFRWPRRRVERVAYLDGAILDTAAVVTTVTFPDAALERTHFTVSSLAMSQCGTHFRQHGLARIAQVHTHPGTWIDHSKYDDAMAYSQHLGAVSIVMPEHARKRPFLRECGVHVRTEAGWARIPAAEVENLIHIVPSVLDFRQKHK